MTPKSKGANKMTKESSKKNRSQTPAKSAKAKAAKSKKKGKKTPQNKISLQSAVDTLVSRFILSWPEEIPLDSTRLFFQLEQAHWFYEDFYADKHGNLPHFHSLKKFCSMIFKRSKVFPADLKKKFPKMYLAFTKYRKSVPAFGAILLNPKRTKVVLVESWKHHVWGFPKGKINEGESDSLGAVREVKEEIGFDISSRVKEEEFIELKAKTGKINKLFIIRDVPETTKFKIHVRKEIRSVRWFHIENILSEAWIEKNASVGNFSNAQPFVRQLKRWMRTCIDASIDARSKSEEDGVAAPCTDGDDEAAHSTKLATKIEATRDFENFAFDVRAVMAAFRGGSG